MSTVVTRMGDGSTVELTRDEIRRDVVEGSEAAAAKAKIPALDENEYDYLVDMFCCPSRVWGVERGHEAVMTKDGGTNTLISSRLSSGIAAPIGRETAVRLFERAFAFDSMEVGHLDYSVKPSKFIVSVEQEHMELLQHTTVLPLFYGFMPNLGLYYRPDGQFENPSDLLPLGKIDEARRTQEEALEACHDDVVWQRKMFAETGATASTTTPSPPPATPSSSPRCAPPSDLLDHQHAGRGQHGRGDGPRLPRRARVRRHPARRPLAAPADEAGREGRRGDLRPRRQQQQHASRAPGTSPAR